MCCFHRPILIDRFPFRFIDFAWLLFRRSSRSRSQISKPLLISIFLDYLYFDNFPITLMSNFTSKIIVLWSCHISLSRLSTTFIKHNHLCVIRPRLHVMNSSNKLGSTIDTLFIALPNIYNSNIVWYLNVWNLCLKFILCMWQTAKNLKPFFKIEFTLIGFSSTSPLMLHCLIH